MSLSDPDDWLSAWILAFIGAEDLGLDYTFRNCPDGLHIEVTRELDDRILSLNRIVSMTEMEQTMIPKEQFTHTVATKMMQELMDACPSP